MTKILKKFKTWLSETRSFWFSWFTKDKGELQPPEKSLIEIPLSTREKLVAAIQNLPINSTEQHEIESTLDEALENWLAHPENADNSIIFLSSPVSSVSRILTESLEYWSRRKAVSLQILPWNSRPQAPEEIEPQLRENIALESETPKSEVIVIPNLNWCFLRSVEGLDGIDYLQDLLLQNRSRFWIIASGQVAWQYLKSVCCLQAYCPQTITLPKLDGEKLQTWLKPIVEDLEITFAPPDLDSQLFDKDQTNQKQYFNKLADITEGVSTVAVQVFLSSIAYQPPEEEKDEEKTESASGTLQAQTPQLPSLPPLEQQDYYLLFSLLLHGDITTSSNLAKSLGDEHYKVQDRVQILRRRGIIEQRNQVLKINPIHYPKLKRELANNNFIID